MNAFYPLRRPKTIFSFVFVLLVIASVAALALQQHEPFYEGKRLSVWLEELDLANNLFDHAKRQKAVNAVRAMGTNAMPSLVRMLAARDSRLKLTIMRVWIKQSVIPMPFTIAGLRRDRAVQAIRVIGPAASPYIPELAILLNLKETTSSAARALAGIGPQSVEHLVAALDSPSNEVRASAAMGLNLLRSDAKPAVPALILRLRDKEPTVRDNATLALGAIRAEPDLVVPALAELLHDKDAGVRVHAARALGDFGSNAKAASQALLKALEDEDGEVRGGAKTALDRINGKTEKVDEE